MPIPLRIHFIMRFVFSIQFYNYLNLKGHLTNRHNAGVYSKYFSRQPIVAVVLNSTQSFYTFSDGSKPVY